MKQHSNLLWSGLLSLSMMGCVASRDELKQVSPREWTKEECLTVMLSSVATNVFDHRYNIKVIAVPYFPSVVEAITRLAEYGDTIDNFETKYKYNLDALLKSSTGLYYDWEKSKYFSPKGHYYDGIKDLDSLLVLVTLINTGWPCASPVIHDEKLGVSYPLFTLSNMPCDTPELDNLNHQIKLVNGQGDTLLPQYVWGRKNSQLTSEEDLFVMFHLQTADKKHFLTNTNRLSFIINLPGTKLNLPISMEYID